MKYAIRAAKVKSSFDKNKFALIFSLSPVVSKVPTITQIVPETKKRTYLKYALFDRHFAITIVVMIIKNNDTTKLKITNMLIYLYLFMRRRRLVRRRANSSLFPSTPDVNGFLV
jgi:hypothetical protein